MPDMTRRDIANISAGAAIVGNALLPRRATAAIFEQNSTGAGTVDVTGHVMPIDGGWTAR